ncbi:MAG TPA: hypothetical protein VGD79_03145 [Thermoanaerobaculia bacterium]
MGPPPPVETVEALLRGELPEAEAQRVREILAYYPELVRVMTASAPAPEEETSPVLTDAQREEDLASIRQRLGLGSTNVVELPPRRREPVRYVAIAAGIAIAVLLGVVVFMQQRQPRVLTQKVLIADAARATRGGPAPPPVALAKPTDYLLKPLYRPTRSYRAYRLALVDLGATPPHSVWKQDDVERRSDGSFPAELSTDDLRPGDYELVLYGIDAAAERLATYTLRIE